jgi:hypothetical protein
VAVGLQSPYAPAQQYPFKLLDIGGGGGHRLGFRRGSRASCLERVQTSKPV